MAAPPKPPKKSQVGKKAQIEKLVQETKNGETKKSKPKVQYVNSRGHKNQLATRRMVFQRSEGPEVRVQLPTPLAYQSSRPLTIRIKAEPVAPLTRTMVGPASPVSGPKKPNVWLPDTKPFRFLELPGEIRNKIYRYFFKPQHFKIKFMSRKVKALTYIYPDRARCHDPKVPLSAARRRRQHDYPRRVRSNETDIPPFELMSGPCALLNAHPRIGREAAPFFYELHTFSFSSCRVLNKFMDMLPGYSKQAIKDVRLSHYTAGYPRWNFITYLHRPSGEERQYTTQRFKVMNDNLWEETLWRLQEEIPNMEKLGIYEVINEIPMEVHENAYWRVPLAMALSEMPKLKEVDIKFKSFHAEDTVLEVEAYKLQQELLAEPYRDTDDAIEYVSDSEQPERLLPPERRGPAKISC